MTNKKLGVALVVIIAIAIGVYGFLKTEKPLGNAATDHYFAEVFHAGFSLNNSRSTTTSATTYTLTAADVGQFDTIIQTLSGGAATFTMPATSTMKAVIPAAGQRFTQCWLPLTNGLTFVAGTGIDLETASSSPTDLTVLVNNTACLTFIRQTDTDITVLMSEFTDGD